MHSALLVHQTKEELIMKNNVIAVTGISGLVGQTLLPYLETDPNVSQVVGLDRRPLPSAATNNKLQFHQMDVRAPQVENLLGGVDVLVHLAFVLLRPRQQSKDEVDSINIQGTQTLCEAAARQGVCKLIILSSIMAYGLHRDNPIPLTEDMPLRSNPNNFYSRAKGTNARFLDRFTQEHPAMVVTRLRPCTIVGPHAPPEQMASLTGDTALVVRGAEPPYQLLHEEDMAQAVYLVIRQDAPGIYNVAGDDPQPLRRLAETHGVKVMALPFAIVRSLMGLTWWLGQSPMGPEFADLARYPAVVSTSKLKALGWQPRYTTPQAYAALRADPNHRQT
jgi:nucleoside-diphosphate-sugar epimerase